MPFQRARPASVPSHTRPFASTPPLPPLPPARPPPPLRQQPRLPSPPSPPTPWAPPPPPSFFPPRPGTALPAPLFPLPRHCCKQLLYRFAAACRAILLLDRLQLLRVGGSKQ